jgi:putative endonuclease
MLDDRKAVGRKAEDRAAAYLLEQGFTIITRRFTIQGGEIDLIALEGDTLVFVEVRLRKSPGMSPEETVDHRKRQRLARAADTYIAQMGEKRDIRFDLIAIEGDQLRHHRDFFRPSL